MNLSTDFQVPSSVIKFAVDFDKFLVKDNHERDVQLLELFRLAILTSEDPSAKRNSKSFFERYVLRFSTPDHMFHACRFGYRDLAVLFNWKVQDLNIKEYVTKKSLLHLAIEGGHESTALWLIQRKAPLEGEDITGKTPLLSACLEGTLNVIKALLAVKGMCVRWTDDEDSTALHLACKPYKEKQDVVFRMRLALGLLARGAWPSIKNKDGKKACDLITPEERVGLKGKVCKFSDAMDVPPFSKDIWKVIFKHIPKKMLIKEIPLVCKKFNNMASDRLFDDFFKG
jgi:hypothetical protein